MSSVSMAGRFRRLRRWLRSTWLGRVPGLGRFLGKADQSQALPPRKKAGDPLDLLLLETKSVANDPVGMAQATLFGSALAELSLRIPTPSQVLLNGWQSLRSPYDVRADAADEFQRTLLRPQDSNRFYLDLPVVSPSAAAVEASPDPGFVRPQAMPSYDEPIRADDQRLVTTSAMMSDPLGPDFLRRIEALLENPLAEGNGRAGGAMSGGSSAPVSDQGVMGGDGGGGGGGGGGISAGPESATGGVNGLASSGDFQAGFFDGGAGQQLTASAANGTVPAAAVGGTAEALAAIQQVGTLPREPMMKPSVPANWGALPLAFEQNLGQTDASVQFLARTQGYTTYLTGNEAVLVLNKERPADVRLGEPARAMVRDVVRVQFVGGAADATLIGGDLLPGRSNYFRAGDNPLHLTDVPQFRGVVAQDVWSGVDVRFVGDGQSLRFDLVAESGVDVSNVRLAYPGMDLAVNGEGQLVLHTPGGDVIQRSPVVYQERNGTREDLTGGYTLDANGHVGFQVSGRSADAALVIDPTLLFSTYLGGSGTDEGNGVAIDLAGNVYVAGTTGSTNFPTTSGAYQTSKAGNTDAFVTKFNAAGSALIYSTYLGGGSLSTNSGSMLAVDAAGAAYLTGKTNASNFPTTSGAYQMSIGGSDDGFVTKLSTAGNALIFSSLLGGSGSDEGRSITVDGAGYVSVAGKTASSNFPTVSAYQSALSGFGDTDAFATRLKPDGSGAAFSTYLGGTSTDEAYGVALDPSGNVYVTGTTQSSNFDTTASVYDSSLGGSKDAFVSKFTPSGSLSYSGYLGGSSDEEGRGIAVDSSGQAHVTGWTESSNFPTSGGAYDTSLGGTRDAFVAQLSSGGTSLGLGTYLGGANNDEAHAIRLDSSGNIYLTGSTTSTNFPTASAYQTAHGDSLGSPGDAFVTRMAAGGGSLDWSTFLGGNAVSIADSGNAIAIDINRNVVVTGTTASTNFPTVAPYQGSNGGGNSDAFLARFDAEPFAIVASISTDSGSSGSDEVTTDQTLSITGTSTASATVTVYRSDLVNSLGTTSADGNGAWTYDYTGSTLSEGTYTFTATATVSSVVGPRSQPLLVVVDRTNPTVTISVDSSTYDTTPTVKVTATDAIGFATSPTVYLDVDLNNDNDFADATETGYTTGTLSNGTAIIAIAPALALSTVRVQARVSDKAGNEGTSAASTVVVSSSGSAWTTTDATGTVDALGGDGLLQRGNLNIVHPLDWDQSPGTDVGGAPYLSFNSERVDVKPIIAAQVQTDNGVALPTTITVTLTWNGGSPQTPVSYSTSGFAPGDLIVVADQVSSAVTTTDKYTYSFEVKMDYSPTPITRTVTGSTYVVAEDTSAYGAGWTFGGVDKLVSVTGGLLRVYGSSGHGFYTDSGGGTYTSPAGDPGTLTSGNSSYVYEAPSGEKWKFDSSGYLVKRTAADSATAISYTYDSGKLSKVETPDGAIGTFTYVSGKLSKIEVGSRTTTMTIASDDLTVVQNPDAGLHTFTYSSHRMATDALAPLSNAYSYTNGAVTSITAGDGGATTIAPAILKGKGSIAVVPSSGKLSASTTDALSRTQRWTLDSSGRPTELTASDGGKTQWTRDADGWITKVTDPLSQVTSYTRDSDGYVTRVDNPDGTHTSYAYQSAFHALTTFTDERGNTWVNTFDGDGHQLTAKDPLNNVTSFTWSSGLMQTTQDALTRVTSYGYDAARRMQTTTNALGDVASITYDSNGNVATTVDQLARTTSYVNDALGRVTQTTNALGGVMSQVYNAAGMVTSATDVRGYRTNYEYNSRGLVTRVIEAVGTSAERSTLSTYDSASQQTQARDANGYTSQSQYDSAGRPVASVDAFSNADASIYDLKGQLTKSRDKLGNESTNTFDTRGRTTKTTDAMGGVWSTTYDDGSNVTERIDPLGNKTTYSYDALNRQIGVTEGAGSADERRRSTTFDAVGNVATEVDWLNRTTSYLYDALNRTTKITEATGTADERFGTYAYDKVSNQTGATDYRGYRTESTYDALNRRTVYKEAVGETEARTTTTAYDAAGSVTSVVDPRGNTTSNVYDQLGRMVSRTEAVGTSVARTVTMLYDAAGQSTGSVNGLEEGGQSGYDALGRPVAGVDPLWQVGKTAYNGNGNVLGSTDARGNKSAYVYDKLNRVVQSTDALGNVSSVVYDSAGNQIAVVDGLGNRSSFVYDALNRQTETQNALGFRTTSVYDDGANVLRTIDQAGKTYTYTFDNLDRQVTVTDSGGGVATTVYDDANVVNTIDQLGNKATFVYDALNRKTKNIDALGGVTSFVFDGNDNMVNLIDPVGNKTTFVYDELNRQNKEIDPLGKTLTTVYDKADRVTTQTDRTGRNREYSYDLAGRVTVETWKSSGGATVDTLTHTYDANGNELTAANGLGTYTMTYDALNRPTVVKGIYTATLSLTYDAVGNRTKVEDSFGGVQTSTYDALHRLTRRDQGGSGTVARFDYTYTNRDQIESVKRYSDLAGSTKFGESTFTYDTAARVQNLQHKDGSNNLLSNYTYTYDLASRVTTEVLNGTTTSYGYDATNQLTSAGATNYDYDANGNRDSAGYTTGAANRMSNDGVYTYTYDDEGNLTKRSKGANAETWTYGYEHLNQLTTVEERSTDGGGTLLAKATYVYDVFSRRVEEQEYVDGSGTTTRRFAYLDRGPALVELDGSNVLQTRYVHRGNGDYSGIETRISGANIGALLTDRLGTTRQVVNGSGTLISTVTYDAFGGIPNETGSATSSGRYLHQGLGYSRASQEYFADHRPRGAAFASWNSEDPERTEGSGSNLYEPMGNNPTNATDPNGLEPQFGAPGSPPPFRPSPGGAHGVAGIPYGSAYFPPYGALGLGGAFGGRDIPPRQVPVSPELRTLFYDAALIDDGRDTPLQLVGMTWPPDPAAVRQFDDLGAGASLRPPTFRAEYVFWLLLLGQDISVNNITIEQRTDGTLTTPQGKEAFAQKNELVSWAQTEPSHNFLVVPNRVYVVREGIADFPTQIDLLKRVVVRRAIDQVELARVVYTATFRVEPRQPGDHLDIKMARVAMISKEFPR